MRNAVGLSIFLAAFLLGIFTVPPPAKLLDVPPVAYVMPPQVSPIHEAETRTQPFQPASFSIEILRNDPDFEIEEQVITPSPDGPAETDIPLGLGESIENQIIQLHSPENRTYKIEQQFETSMAIGDEGPHFDLLDWKHYTSPWRPIKSGVVGGVDDHKYFVPELIEAEFTRFPSVTTKEIVAALRNSGADKRWVDHARTCTGPNSGPCYVSTSRISIRVSVKENNRWKLIHTLNFHIPLGC